MLINFLRYLKSSSDSAIEVDYSIIFVRVTDAGVGLRYNRIQDSGVLSIEIIILHPKTT